MPIEYLVVERPNQPEELVVWHRGRNPRYFHPDVNRNGFDFSRDDIRDLENGQVVSKTIDGLFTEFWIGVK